MRIFYIAFIAMLSCCCASVWAQDAVTDLVYDFSEAAADSALQSEIKFVYADSSEIVVAGNVQHPGGQGHIFTAAFGYGGSLLWKREIAAPAGFYKSEISGFTNLKKLNNGNYALAGQLTDVPANDSLHIPFLYIFSGGGGDSVSLQQISQPLRKLDVLNYDDAGHIMLAGPFHKLADQNIGIQQVETFDTLWIAQYDAAGNALWQHHLAFGIEACPLLSLYNVYDIIWQPAYNSYTIALGSPLGSSTYQFLTIPPSPPIDDANTPNGSVALGENPATQPIGQYAGFCKRRETDDINFFCSAYTIDGFNTILSTYYGLEHPTPFVIQTWGKTYHSPLDSDTALMDNGGMAVREALNGDMIMLKTAVTHPFVMTPNYLPFLMRADSNGNILWKQYYTRIHTTDTNIDQYLNDMSVAPDGRIVLAGAIKSRAAVPSVWDTTGSISWLVILNDSTHDGNVGVHELPDPLAQQVSVYPNPATGRVYLQCGSLKVLQVRLTDYNGRAIRSFAPQSATLDIAGIAAGMYLVEVATDKGIAKKKIVIQ